MGRRFLLLPLSFLLLAASGPAFAYCRTSACEGHPSGWHVCTPAQVDDCGQTFFRVRPRVSYSVQRDASTQVSLATTRDLVRQAFQTWTSVDCGGGQPPRVELEETEPVECRAHEYNKTRGNANIILFREDTWDDDHAKIAVTTVTHVLETGEIYDADMEINAVDFHFSTEDGQTGIDLLSILTHETGHFLGLAHSPEPGATMMTTYPAAEPLSLRSLTDDDQRGICAVYPPGEIRDECDATPRHGFSSLCAADQASPPPEPPAPEDEAAACCCPEGWECLRGLCSDPGGCGCTAAGAGEGGGWTALGVALVAWAARRRRWTTTPGPSGYASAPR